MRFELRVTTVVYIIYIDTSDYLWVWWASPKPVTFHNNKKKDNTKRKKKVKKGEKTINKRTKTPTYPDMSVLYY